MDLQEFDRTMDGRIIEDAGMKAGRVWCCAVKLEAKRSHIVPDDSVVNESAVAVGA